MELSKFIGFYPFINVGEYFSIADGIFTNQIPLSGAYLRGDEKNVFNALLGMKIANCHELKISNTQRKQALKNILDYFRIHNVGMGEIKSHIVLETIFI